MLKQPRIKSPSARHDAARLPTSITVDIDSKVHKSSAVSDEPPADPNMEQKSGKLVPGGRVVFLSRSGLHRGSLKYVGRVQFAEGEWCGVELDKPEEGCHVGAVDNVEYFRCEESRGVFVERWKVCREGQEEEIKAADVQCVPPAAKTLFSPESETRLPQLKFKSKIPSSLKSKTVRSSSSSSSAMAPLRVTLDVNKSNEGQVHVRTFVDLRGSDAEKIESTGQRIKETESATAGSGGGMSSGDHNLQHHYSTVRTIRKSQSRSYRPAVYQRTNDNETDGMAVGADGKGNIPLFLSDKENSRRSKSDQSSDDVATSMTNELTGEMEGFQSDGEDLHSSACCIQPFMSLYNHSVKESNPTVARNSGISAKLPLCQGQSAAESGDGFSSVRSQSDRPVAEDDATGSRASMPNVIGPSEFFSKIPRMQRTDDDEDEDEDEEDEFGDGDYLAASQTSLASSLGILNDSDILEDTCFFPEGFACLPGNQLEQSEGRPGNQPEQSEGQPEQSEGEAEKSEGQAEKLEGQAEKSEGQPEKSEGQAEPSEGQAEKSEGQPEKSEGQEQSQGQAEQLEGQPEQSEGQPEQSGGQPEQPEGQPERSEGQREQLEGQPEQESCLAALVSSFNDSAQFLRESPDRSGEGVNRGCDDQPSTEDEIAVAAGVVSDDDVVEHAEMEDHSTEETEPANLDENHESVIPSSHQLLSGEHLKAEESLLDIDNVQQTDMESCAENVLPIESFETSEENVTTHDMETSDLTATEEEVCVDAVENEDADDDDDDVDDDDDDDNQRLSNIVVQVELERQLIDRQEHRLSYDDPSDVCNRLHQQLSCVKLNEEKSSSSHASSVAVTPDKENSSTAFEKTSKTPDKESSPPVVDKISKTPEKENSSAAFDNTSKTPDKENSSAAFDNTSKTPDKENSSAAFEKTSKTPEKENSSAAFDNTSKTPEKENSSAAFDKTNKQQSIIHEQNHQEVEKTPGGVGDKGGSSMGSKAKLIKTIQISRPHLTTLEEKNEDPKRAPSNGNAEKAANRERKDVDKRQPPAGKPRMAADTGKPSIKGVSGLHRNLGRVKSFDAPSQMPAIPPSPRAVPSVGENAGVNRLRRTRVASLDLGNTSSSSSSSSLKRSGMRRETLWETTKLHEPTKERGVTERPQFGRTQTLTTAAAKKRPSLLLHLNSSFSPGKTYAVVKNNKTPSDSNLFSSETTVVPSSMLSRRTSTPLPSAEDPASCSSSMSLESSRAPGVLEKPISVSANKKGLKNPSLAINSRSKATNAGKPGQLKQKIGKKTEKIANGKTTGSKQEQEWHQQQHHQPDLVPNTDAKDKEMAEIIRLERLSEARLQQLNRLNAELQCRTKWFQALVIVVQQLSQRMDDRNGLRCRLNECLEEVDSVRKQLQELTRQRDALVDEIQSVKEEEEQRRETLKRDHQVQLNDLKEALQMQHDENLHRALNDHSRKIAVVEMNHQQQIGELKEFHEQVIAENREDHMSSLNAQKSEHDNILQELKYQQDRQLNDITLRFEHIKLCLSEKVECLRSECEEMRRREATYMENCQAEMEQKLQQILMPYRHLPQEIESLKAVVDLRNLELHDLRHHNIQLQRQVEELPAAQETIKKFQQKVENLEAVVKIRADYERQLSEKHQQLLCRYDRESKANKRLSMDKEELLWRLSSSQTAEQLEASASSPSFDAFQRSLSHSLATANDCGGGGGVNSGVEMRKSMSQSASSSSPSVLSVSPIVSRMQRSGTYDLLCDVLDDEDTKGGSRSSSSD